ncbi:MAG: RusA family crossover junction endodeoxyribonuclease [Legionellales bacterium]|jgi:Holliday junction resolvase RusA-like endonuclease
MASKIIHFDVLGTPVGKGRPRFARRGNFVTTYSPQKNIDAERSLLAQSIEYKPETPWNCALGIRIEAIFERPKSHYGTGRNVNLLKDTAPLFHTCKPDGDNVGKNCIDAMNEVFFKDDSQIVVCNIIKQYGNISMLRIWLWQIETLSDFNRY